MLERLFCAETLSIHKNTPRSREQKRAYRTEMKDMHNILSQNNLVEILWVEVSSDSRIVIAYEVLDDLVF
jgi:hypothetical protein